MGLFGYNRGTYIKNTKRFKKTFDDFLLELKRGYGETSRNLNRALVHIDEDYPKYPQSKCIKATDARIDRYVREMKEAYRKGDSAMTEAYSFLISEAVGVRRYGDAPEDATLITMKERSAIASFKLRGTFAAMEEYLKVHKDVDKETDPGYLRLLEICNELTDEYNRTREAVFYAEEQLRTKKNNTTL